MSIVAKFGGSSVGSSDGMKRCCNIVLQNKNISLVVVSATYNTTNNLETVAKLSLANLDDAKFAFDSIIERHIGLAEQLGVLSSVQESIANLRILGIETVCALNRYSKESLDLEHMDTMYSYGEKLSSLIFYALLSSLLKEQSDSRKVALIDTQKFLITDECFGSAKPDLKLIKKKSLENEDFFQQHCVVTQGFIGSTIDSKRTTLGREGSDYSATLMAEAFEKSEVQIWTDVAGIFTADPREVRTAKFVPELSYKEAANLATSGAKVLFPKTLEPAKRSNIPVTIKCSKSPELPGSKIFGKPSGAARATGIVSQGRQLTIVGVNLFKIEDTFHKLLTDKNCVEIEKTEDFFQFRLKDDSTAKSWLSEVHDLLFSE